MSYKVLIAGGSGFIGRHFVSACVERGYRCTVTSTKARATLDLPKYVELIKTDLSNFDDVKESLSGYAFDFVVNLNGYVSHLPFFGGGFDVLHNHFSSLQNLLRCIDRNELKHFVHIGSSDEYGLASAPQTEAMICTPMTSYAFAKFASTELLMMLNKTEAFPCTVIRPFLVYGSGQKLDRFLPQLINACINDETFVVSSGGSVRDFCHVTDFVRGVLEILETDCTKGQIINVASGVPVSIRSLTKMTRDIVGLGKLVFPSSKMEPNKNNNLVANISKVKKAVGWTPKISLEEGLVETVDWYKKNYG